MIDTLSLDSDQVGDRMRGAWLGMFAADFMASGANAQDSLSPSSLSLSVVEAIITLEALGPLKRFCIESISNALVAMQAQHPGADFDHVADEDGGLLRCLTVSLWFRGKPVWRIAEALELCLDVSPVEPRGRIATLALCLWARELHALRRPGDVWQRNLKEWKSAAIGMGYDPADVASVLDDNNAPADEDDELVEFMVEYFRKSVDDLPFEDYIRATIEDTDNRRSLVAAAGFFFGLSKGDRHIPAAWSEALAHVPEFERTLAILMDKQASAPSLRQNLDVTSKNSPLVLSPVACLQGHLVLTTAPGCSRTMGYSDRGIVQVRRRMSVDIEHLSTAGASHLLTLLRGDELVDAEMTGLRMAAEDAGLEWLHLPFIESDMTQPYFTRELKLLVPQLRKILAAGGSIIVHAHDWQGRFQRLIPKLLSLIDPSLSGQEAKALVEQGIEFGEQNDNSMQLA